MSFPWAFRAVVLCGFAVGVAGSGGCCNDPCNPCRPTGCYPVATCCPPPCAMPPMAPPIAGPRHAAGEAAARLGTGVGGTRFAQFKIINGSKKWKVRAKETYYLLTAVDNDTEDPALPRLDKHKCTATSDVNPGAGETAFRFCDCIPLPDSVPECNYQALVIEGITVVLEHTEDAARVHTWSEAGTDCETPDTSQLVITVTDKADIEQPPDVKAVCEK
jgi:hypothetical protein